MSYTMPQGGKASAGRRWVNDFMRSPWYLALLAGLTVLSSVFMILNLVKPEIHDETLMPALPEAFSVSSLILLLFP